MYIGPVLTNLRTQYWYGCLNVFLLISTPSCYCSRNCQFGIFHTNTIPFFNHKFLASPLTFKTVNYYCKFTGELGPEKLRLSSKWKGISCKQMTAKKWKNSSQPKVEYCNTSLHISPIYIYQCHLNAGTVPKFYLDQIGLVCEFFLDDFWSIQKAVLLNGRSS